MNIQAIFNPKDGVISRNTIPTQKAVYERNSSRDDYHKSCQTRLGFRVGSNYIIMSYFGTIRECQPNTMP